MTRTTPTDFETLVRRAGLSLSPEQIADIYQGWGYVEQMIERVRTHGRGREAEPAHIFVVDRQ
jgi:hypothetical protein